MAYRAGIVISDMTRSKYGIVTPICDGKEYLASDSLTYEEKVLADAIIEMLSNQELRDYYITNSNEVARKFSIEKMVEAYYQLAE